MANWWDLRTGAAAPVVRPRKPTLAQLYARGRPQAPSPGEALKSFALGVFKGSTGLELAPRANRPAVTLGGPGLQTPVQTPYRPTVPEAAQTGNLLAQFAVLAPAAAGLAKAGVRVIAREAAEQVARRAAETDPLVQKIVVAVKAAKPLRIQQEALYSAERSARLGRAMAIPVTSVESYGQRVSALAGKLPKVAMPPQVTPEDVAALFQKVENHPLLSGFGKIRTQGAVVKLLQGTVPQKGELILLRRAFGDGFVREIGSPAGAKAIAALGETIGIPRAIMASTDFSFPFRQGIVAAAGYPKQFVGSFGAMFRSALREESYTALKESLVRRPTFALMEEHGLALPGLTELAAGEEVFAPGATASLAEKIPVAGRVIRASDRAYTAFALKLRADIFDEFVRTGIAAGVENTGQYLKSAARFINAATGRGDLGRLGRAANELGTALFSPRLLAARVNMLDPRFYVEAHPLVRKQMIRTMLSFVGGVSTILGLVKLAGGTVGTDTRSADFAKIKIGNTRLDISGGFQQYPRLAGQLATKTIISSTTGKEIRLGEGYRPLTPLDIVLRFFESKANPMVGFFLDFLRGRTFEGEQPALGKEMRNLLTPMVVQDILDLYRENPKTIPLILPGIFGVSVQTYGPKRPVAQGQNWWNLTSK